MLYELNSIYKTTLDKLEKGSPTESLLEKFNDVQGEYFNKVHAILPSETVDAIRTLVNVREEIKMIANEREYEISQAQQKLEYSLQESERPEIIKKAEVEEATKNDNLKKIDKKSKFDKLFDIETTQEQVNYDRINQRILKDEADKIHKHSDKKDKEIENLKKQNQPLDYEAARERFEKMLKVEKAIEMFDPSEKTELKKGIELKNPLTPTQIAKYESQLSPEVRELYNKNYISVDGYNTKRELIEARQFALLELMSQNTDEGKALTALLEAGQRENVTYAKMPTKEQEEKNKINHLRQQSEKEKNSYKSIRGYSFTPSDAGEREKPRNIRPVGRG